MTETVLNLNLLDEMTIIFLWIGIWGICDILLNIPFMYQHKHYFYILLILI